MSALMVVLGAWLTVSAFLLPHGAATSWNDLVLGPLVCAVALLAYCAPGRPGLRYVNTLLAAWLFASGVMLPHVSAGTAVHDMLVALALAGVSILPGGGVRSGEDRGERGPPVLGSHPHAPLGR